MSLSLMTRWGEKLKVLGSEGTFTVHGWEMPGLLPALQVSPFCDTCSEMFYRLWGGVEWGHDIIPERTHCFLFPLSFKLPFTQSCIGHLEP